MTASIIRGGATPPRDARHLYDTLGYVEVPGPMMFKVALPGLAKPGGFR
jgi:hypothetical protein